MTRGKPQLNCANTTGVTLTGMDLACGQVQLRVGIEPDIFSRFWARKPTFPSQMKPAFCPVCWSWLKPKRRMTKSKAPWSRFRPLGTALLCPVLRNCTWKSPKSSARAGRYGVRLSASAPSLHLMRATIHTELSPTVGSEEQGETLIQGLLKDFESDPSKLWSTNIFGKSLNELVNEGLQAKLMHMPAEARTRLQQTLERIINDGCDGLICILL